MRARSRSPSSVAALWALALLLVPAIALAASDGQQGSIGSIALALGIILAAAVIGGDLAIRAGQPAVLGELVAGILLGNLGLLGFHGLDFLAREPGIELLASVGVLILLFEVGLESTVREMLAVGFSALLVALIGAATPFALGWLVGHWLLPNASTYVHVFLGAAITATSIGITARVLQDLHRAHIVEARIILGATVIDDVLGLIILAIVVGAIQASEAGRTLALSSIAWITGKAVLFFGGAIALGVALSPRIFRLASGLRGSGVLLAIGLASCFLLAWASGEIGLAPIIGAFAAGLILESVHYRDFLARGELPLEELVRPISRFLAPVFFVVMGLRTDLAAFAVEGTIGLALALTVAAIVGKQLCSLGVLERGLDRLSVGIAMVPRGEVGLIFANIGATLTLRGEPILDARSYAAVVVVVIFTTLVTPPALRFSLRRERA